MLPPKWTINMFLWVLVALITAMALYGTRPPAAVGVTSPATEFSADRAIAHLHRIADRPHSIGTNENYRVRDYLMLELAALGAELRLETTTGIFSRARSVRAGTVQNIVATFPGSLHGRAVMLVAHYDSVPEGPGAADDGAGVITILETMRALKTGPVLKNDVVVLFTDGEEAGLLGAAGFVADHPDLPNRIAVALNLEARGSSGPALMFETSDENGWLMGEFARAAPYPMASSLMYSIYKLLPNNTDLSVLKRVGLDALNFAFTETFQDYHSRLDTPENLDRRSVQHLGANVLALTRHFGNLPLLRNTQPDIVYFNWFGSRLVAYPVWVVWVLSLVITTLFCLVRAVGYKRGLISLKLSGAGFGSFFLLLLVVAGGALLAWAALKLSTGHLLNGDTGSNELLFLGLLGVGLALGTILLNLIVTKLGFYNVAAGQLLAVSVLAIVISFLLPGASYFLQWPALFGLGSVLFAMQIKQPAGAAMCGLLAALPAILILAPLTYFLFVALDLNIVLVLVAAILLTLLLAVTSQFVVHAVRPLPGVILMLIGSAFVLIWGTYLSHFSAEHPNRDSIVYSVNADQGKAKWISYDGELDTWTSQFLGKNPAKRAEPAFTIGSIRECLAMDAPVLPLAAPTATLVGDKLEGAVRILKMHITSVRHAHAVVVRLPAETKVLAAACNGRSAQIGNGGKPDSQWYLRYDAIPPEGLDLELRLGAQNPLKCWVGDSSLGLPQIPGQSYEARPKELMSNSGSDVTLVGRQYTF